MLCLWVVLFDSLHSMPKKDEETYRKYICTHTASTKHTMCGFTHNRIYSTETIKPNRKRWDESEMRNKANRIAENLVGCVPSPKYELYMFGSNHSVSVRYTMWNEMSQENLPTSRSIILYVSIFLFSFWSNNFLSFCLVFFSFSHFLVANQIKKHTQQHQERCVQKKIDANLLNNLAAIHIEMKIERSTKKQQQHGKKTDHTVFCMYTNVLF